MAKKSTYIARTLGVGAPVTAAAAVVGQKVGEYIGGRPFQVQSTQVIPNMEGGAPRSLPSWVDASQPMLNAAAENGGKVGAIAGTLLGGYGVYRVLSHQFRKGKK